ncbi:MULTISPECIES: helix-turn-helix domain-containing protein [Blautia]|uniref:helix-turn-helix domain-containing protein n=1 Tax=Blautia TaxID=572511 RepID=UPI000BA4C06F|nr:MULTISPECIES: helix-turn-helix domain-containing protein [Blautia]
MEFNEKLQHLRKQKHLTQEQLAEKLYVSRAAVSKWESGKGYPNIESLKAVSELFSVSIDDLLSGKELLTLAEKENRSNINTIYGLIFGILDMITAVFFVLPLFGQEDKDYIRMVTLFSNTTISAPIKTIYYVLLISLTVFGAVELFIQNLKDEKKINLCKTGSILLHALTITFFAMSQQPYVTVFLFMLFMVKVVLLIKKNGMK